MHYEEKKREREKDKRMKLVKEILEKVLKKRLSAKCYIVSGQQFLTGDDLAKLLSRTKSLYFREYGERGLGRPITLENTPENAWIYINTFFSEVSMALYYARRCMNESLDGGNVTIQVATESFLLKENRNTIYELRKENGEIVEIDLR